MQNHKFIFIGGLHRSGKTLLYKHLKEHPLISAFKGIGDDQDEGQHLQSVYLPAKFFGGPGRFGFKSGAHMSENSPLVSEENRIKLFSDWEKYWETEKPFLLEQSPPNLIRTRFLQKMFPNSYFIIIMRHPVAVTYTTRKIMGSRATMYSLIKHWLICHEIFNTDKSFLKNLLVLKYENFVKDPHLCLERVYGFLGIENHLCSLGIHSDINLEYFNKWIKNQKNIFTNFYIDLIRTKYEKRINAFNYSLRDLEMT